MISVCVLAILALFYLFLHFIARKNTLTEFLRSIALLDKEEENANFDEVIGSYKKDFLHSAIAIAFISLSKFLNLSLFVQLFFFIYIVINIYLISKVFRLLKDYDTAKQRLLIFNIMMLVSDMVVISVVLSVGK